MQPETQRLLTLLRATHRALGISSREMERRLGLSPGYLSRLLAGKVELRVDHVCQIARAVGLEPAEVFQMAFPVQPGATPSSAASRLRDTLGAWVGSPGGAASGAGPGSSPGQSDPASVPPAAPATATPQPAAADRLPPGTSSDVEQLFEKTLRRLFRELGREEAE